MDHKLCMKWNFLLFFVKLLLGMSKGSIVYHGLFKALIHDHADENLKNNSTTANGMEKIKIKNIIF